MADNLEKAMAEGNSGFLAIMGDAHIDGVVDNLRNKKDFIYLDRL